MKKALLFVLAIALSITLSAQEYVTTFMGIPVDGTKKEMVKKLKKVGFKNNTSIKGVLDGEFNGEKVNVKIGTNKERVCRIMVSDAVSTSAANAIIRFNRLYKQFLNNERYIEEYDYREIPEHDEDIAYEMSVNNKRYQAAFYQLPENLDIDELMDEIELSILSRCSEDRLADLKEEEYAELFSTYSVLYLSEKYSKNLVWFQIAEKFGEYVIVIFYDNESNRAHGEDL